MCKSLVRDMAFVHIKCHSFSTITATQSNYKLLVNVKHCGASLRKRQFLVICTHSYITAADGPVCHLHFNCHSASAASTQMHSYICSERGLDGENKLGVDQR